ncbi:MAG: hypothetical protein K9G58_00675 [Bacteroidales bacterium]|nr:hypothetical protein [Bacteroidales bacterium]MCF8388580.1 hypothetical protein [Bacteroidales bacterium]MCF8396648.1 hypothetical protein [Bacteroidales bacterium]
MKYIFYTLIFLFLLGFIASCSIERKIARDYIDNDSKGAILLFTPDYVFKKSLKEKEVQDADQYTDAQFDSVLFYRSEFLQYIDDSVFLEKLVNQYIDEMKAYGFDIFTQDYIDLFMQQDTTSFVINMAQIELEEYFYDYEFEEMVGFDTYTANIPLDAINCNAWFEIKRVNEKKQGKEQLLFATHYITDDLYGQFRQNVLTGDVKLEYTVDSLYLEDIYDFAVVLGTEYAMYTFDYLLNRHIDEQIVDENYKAQYLQYDPATGKFFNDLEDGFEVLE